MTITHTDRWPDTGRLVRALVPCCGSSISLDALVSSWMARNLSDQLLFEQLSPMLRRRELVLIYDAEGTRVSLGDNRLDQQHSGCRNECLTHGEVAEFAAAVSKARRAQQPVIELRFRPGRRRLELVRDRTEPLA